MAAGQPPVSTGSVLQIQRGDLKFTTGVFNPVDPQQSLPLESTRSANVFHDRFNAQLSWYLPGYQLAADIDATFSFAAGGEKIDVNDNPYYTATITLTLTKVEPPDVTAYRAANPSVQLHEIPLTGLPVTLTTTANELHDGAAEQSPYTATVATDASGEPEFVLRADRRRTGACRLLQSSIRRSLAGAVGPVRGVAGERSRQAADYIQTANHLQAADHLQTNRRRRDSGGSDTTASIAAGRSCAGDGT